MSCQKMKNTFSYKLFLLFGTVLLILMIYFGCGSTTKEVAKNDKEAVLSQAEQDAKRKHQVDLDFNIAFYEYYSHKRYREAIPFYLKAIENDKEVRFPGMYQQLGQCYIEIEESDSAQIAYEMGVEKTPDNIYIHEKLEWIYESKMEIDKAIKECEKIIELGGDKEVYLIKLKSLYVRNDQIDEAIDVYNKLIELHPEDKDLQDQKTNLIKLSGGSVIDEYKKMHEQYPNDKKYIEALLAEYSRNDDDMNAISMADKLLALEPKNILALDKKADAYANLQKWRDRINILKRKMEITGENSEVLSDIAECCNLLKSYSSARSFANRAIKKDSNYGMAYIRIGEAYEYCVEDVVSKKGGFAKMTFDDKLIYELAYRQYQRASKYPDASGVAGRRMNAIRSLLPTKEDKFMSPDKKKASNKAYQWIY